MIPEKCDETRPLLDRALTIKPNDWESYWLLANCSAVNGRWQSADELYRKASDRAPAPDANLLYSWAGSHSGSAAERTTSPLRFIAKLP